MDKFEEIRTTIKAKLENIEDLVKVRDYISMVPSELEKINK